MLRDIFENNVILAILTSVSSLVNRTLEQQIVPALGELPHGGDRATKLSVTSGSASHVFHADFFP